MANSKSLIRTQNFLKKQEFENYVVPKVAWIMKHYFDGILRRILVYKPSKKFSSRAHIRICQNAQTPLRTSVDFDRYGYGLLMKNSLHGLYILLNIPPK
jgi:hypothetical protein